MSAGGTHVFNIVPTAGYSVSVGGTCPTGTWNGSTYTAPTQTGATNVYTTGAINSNCTVSLTATAAAEVEVTNEYNFIGIVNDYDSFSSSAGFDGGGAAFSSQCLPSQLTTSGTSFALGAPETLDMFVASSSLNVTLPSTVYYSKMEVLGSATNGGSTGQTVTLVVTYTDNSTDTTAVRFVQRSSVS